MNAIIYNYKVWIKEIKPEILISKLNELLTISGYKTLSFIEHSFSPQGYTSLWLLAESHLALHTFPEQQRAYIELSSCNEGMNNKFIKEINLWIKKENIGENKGEKQITKP
ncbi:MAG: S-adenosylmethionine decarboxylase [Bacteroidales bacterium]|nr:S-adenosylmethionine decarboxylase [Bacteroidales bacterium]